MCSATRRDDGSDLTARARIRDAAIVCFGRHGFDVTVRAIADQAEVSPGLVIHHFGSKAGLKQACDDHVIGLVGELKTESVTAHDDQGFLRQLASMEEYAPYLAYILRALQTGGPLGASLFERMVADAELYLAAGEAEGTIRPSRDPARRARWLVAGSLGSILMLVTLDQGDQGDQGIDFAEVFREWEAEYMLPALELYTEGLLTERTLLDAYLRHSEDRPEETD